MQSSLLMVAIRGPILLIALGLLFAADQFDYVEFSRTWPVLIILYGVLKLLERSTGPGQTYHRRNVVR